MNSARLDQLTKLILALTLLELIAGIGIGGGRGLGHWFQSYQAARIWSAIQRRHPGR